MDMSKKPAGETRAPTAIRSFLRGLRILSRFALRMTSRLVVANTIRRADKLSFSCHCEAVQTAVAIRSLLRVLRILSRFAFRMTGRLVIAKVRVSGGHLCKAEAPTEPAGEMCKRLRQSVLSL